MTLSMLGQCKVCGGECESWAKVCDDCVAKAHDELLRAAPDRSRCRYCGAYKSASGHSEFVCSQRAERGEL